jgi:hypothetical protein
MRWLRALELAEVSFGAGTSAATAAGKARVGLAAAPQVGEDLAIEGCGVMVVPGELGRRLVRG